jgi:hypothetical protein
VTLKASLSVCLSLFLSLSLSLWCEQAELHRLRDFEVVRRERDEQFRQRFQNTVPLSCPHTTMRP